MITKNNNREIMLLRELESTKHRLLAEAQSREGDVAPQDDAFYKSMAPRNRYLPLSGLDENVFSPARRIVNHGTQLDGSNSGGANNLKRSRSEAGIGIGENDLIRETATKTEKLELSQPITSRIDMLPIMCSTGEDALEVGLSNVAVDGGSTQTVHMLPVFRLPTVSKASVGGFLRRIPREETERERQCRLREEKELEKMKGALGLTDRDLAILEEELLPGKHKGSETIHGRPMCTDDRNKCTDQCRWSDQLVLPLELTAQQMRSGRVMRELANGDGTFTGEKRRKRLAGESSSGGQRGKPDRDPCRYGEESATTRVRQKSGMHETAEPILVDRPTPRILRTTLNPRLRLGLGSSWAPSRVRASTCGGTWDPFRDIGLDNKGGSMLGTAASTDQLVAAAADVGIVNILELRRELGHSVGQVKLLSNAVKDDVQQVIRICPVQNPRAVRFLRRCACQRLVILWEEIILSHGAVALERWRRAVVAIVIAERKTAYLKYQGSSMMAFTLNKMYVRRLAKAWIRWEDFVEYDRAAKRRALEEVSAVTVQTVFRGMMARQRRALLMIAAKEKQRRLAAAHITRCSRGKVARMRYARLKVDFERERAGEVLMRVGRGMLGRQRAQKLREERAQLKAAQSIQRLFRGRRGRQLFMAIKTHCREQKATTRIQAMIRGIWGREHALRVHQSTVEGSSAGRIQREVRAWLARRLVEKMRMEAEKTWALFSAATLAIQRVYRGHRARVLHGTRMEIQRSIRHKEGAAATKIQAFVRAYSSKRRVSKIARKRKDERIESARLWVETWSEDAQAWFYYNSLTGEALWEPPSTGYTKHDGKLVLTTGEVTDDPLSGLTEEERAEARKQSVCVECEEKRATRKCEQCGDAYCTECFRRTHSTGRRAKHIWKHFGPMECAECEAEVAIKWCTACDDPFCGPCWSVIHSRGRRSMHSHCAISPTGRVSAKAIASDGSNAGPFTPGECLRAEMINIGDAAGSHPGNAQRYSGDTPVTGDSSASDWQEYYDDNDIPYWYNINTGLSQYENPFEEQAVWNGSSMTAVNASTDSVRKEGGADDWNGGQWNPAQELNATYRDSPAETVKTEELAGEWSEHFDDEGYAYYYNATSGESQYERPW